MTARAFETLNPMRLLREWEGGMGEAQRQQLKAAQAAFFDAPVARLCDLSAQYLAEPLSSHNPKPIVMCWLINRELTRRGLAPRWRGLPQHVADEPAPNIPETALPPGAPRPISFASRRRALLRWIDLEWLCVIMGPRHAPTVKRLRHLFEGGRLDGFMGEGIAEQIANAKDRPYQVCLGLGVQAPQSFGLSALKPQDAARRVRAVEERVRLKIAPKLDEHRQSAQWPPTPEQCADRLRWVRAIELAQGSPAEAATLYGWMTGTPAPRQAAHKMKRKLADQLDLRGAAWR